jgi:hypothetical protein
MEQYVELYPNKDEIRDRLIEKYEATNKSPYSESYYTNPNKTWNGDIDGGIRVSDHWNFGNSYNSYLNQITPHCMTDVDEMTLKRFLHVAVGRFNADKGIYEIIEIVWLIQTYSLVNPQFDQWLEEQSK